VFEKGNSFPLKVFADIINSCNFEGVEVLDPHSDVSAALINNISITKQAEILSLKRHELQQFSNNFMVVSPDAGALKKIYEVAEELDVMVLECGKQRDISTGKIVGCTVPKLNPKYLVTDLLIVDDICDGGASFTHLADELRLQGYTGKIGLYVTHGIFSKGLEVFKNKLDFILCNDLVCSPVTQEQIDSFNKGE
jgi:ribose-phosphate pyrophosphokinase